uniref:indole-3-pyruvate monooxygenase n=1 Tax=Solanum tuberosum TaxID=4113 RepID=M1DGV4_SOLTU
MYASDLLILATGENNEGYITKMIGIENFKGEIIRSSDYRSGEKYKDKKVLPGILEIKEHTVVFDNGDEHQFDAIIFATGYKNIVAKWLKDYSSIFLEDGTLINWKGENGLYCAGFSKRGIADISMDARAIADDIKTIRVDQI